MQEANNRFTFGAIDIGSNAIRLLIDYVEEYRAPEFKKAAFVRVPIRLGEDVFDKGYITTEKISALVHAMSAFAALFRTFGIDAYKAYATSAMREASNGREVADTIARECGIDIDIVDGNTEARTIYEAGGLEKVLDKAKSYFYIDVGGGSTEVVVYADSCEVEARSFRLGTVRYISEAVSSHEEELFAVWLKEKADCYHPSAIIGSGGNINKAHRLLDKKPKDAIKAKELYALYTRLCKMSVEQRMEEMELNANRADVIVPALSIFTTALRITGAETVVVPKLGLVDGIIRVLYRDYKNGRKS